MLIYMHGNCQARAIAQMVAPEFPEWDVHYYEVFNQKILDECESYKDLVSTADLVISQPIRPGYRDRHDLSLEWVRSHTKPGAPVVVFPSMYFGGQLVGWTSLGIPGFEMEYHDILLIRLVSDGLSTDCIEELLLSESLYSGAFLEQEVALAVAEISRREQADAVDVPFSPFLEQFGLDMPLFHVVNHPCRPALAYMANEILAHVGYPKRIPALGEDHLQFPHIPCAPSVAQYFVKRNCLVAEWRVPDDQLYHFPKEKLERAEYIARAAAHFRTVPADVLRDCLEDHRAKPFIDKIRDLPALKELPRRARPLPPAAPTELGSLSESKSLRQLMLRFESLGGSGHGCEFGLLQRELGAEPLGLLRWADLGHDLLTAALEDEFKGVGEPEHTEIFVPSNDGWQHWWTRDKRYWMAMRTFVEVAAAPYGEMQRQVTQRQKFLRRKLIADLQAGEKIFVYKNMYANLDAEKLKKASSSSSGVRKERPALYLLRGRRAS